MQSLEELQSTLHALIAVSAKSLSQVSMLPTGLMNSITPNALSKN